MTNLIDTNLHTYDTRPERTDDETPDKSSEVWRASHHAEINIWFLLFSLLILTPICIYLSVLAISLSGLVTP